MPADTNVPPAPVSPFVYEDTATTRAGIAAASGKLAGGSIAIVGLGGTGSETLDLVSKTPCDRIVLIDGDIVEQHSAFRAPGAMSLDEIAARPFKVDHFARVYGRMHAGIVTHAEHLGAENLHLLDDVDFVFLCVDSVTARAVLVPALEARGLPFIDSGLGVRLVDEQLMGQVRITTSTRAMRRHVHDGARIPLDGGDDDTLYRSAIQVAELNRLAAVFAVIRYKKLRGFYADTEGEYHSVYTVDGNQVVNADHRR